jgi:hypothetical protein
MGLQPPVDGAFRDGANRTIEREEMGLLNNVRNHVDLEISSRNATLHL